MILNKRYLIERKKSSAGILYFKAKIFRIAIPITLLQMADKIDCIARIFSRDENNELTYFDEFFFYCHEPI